MGEGQCPTCGHITTGFEQQEWEARRGLMMSAIRYVKAYAENENNHPQARAAAAELAAQIEAVY